MKLSRVQQTGLLLVLSPFALAGNDKPAALDTRQQVWKVELASLVKEPAGWMTSLPRHETRGVAFSPDGKRLAVTLAHVEFVRPKLNVHSHVFVLEVDSPNEGVRQFALTNNCGVDLRWNDRSDAILICGQILRLADGTSCTVVAPPAGYPSQSRESSTGRAYWLDSDHVVSWKGTMVDETCTRSDSSGRELIDPAVHSKGWDLKGKIPKQFQGFELLQTTTGSSRALTEQWSYHRGMFDENPFLKQRAVFDLRAETVVSSWNPRMQDSRSPIREDWPYRDALSPDGNLLAESGDGTLELFRVPSSPATP